MEGEQEFSSNFVSQAFALHNPLPQHLDPILLSHEPLKLKVNDDRIPSSDNEREAKGLGLRVKGLHWNQTQP